VTEAGEVLLLVLHLTPGCWCTGCGAEWLERGFAEEACVGLVDTRLTTCQQSALALRQLTASWAALGGALQAGQGR